MSFSKFRNATLYIILDPAVIFSIIVTFFFKYTPKLFLSKYIRESSYIIFKEILPGQRNLFCQKLRQIRVVVQLSNLKNFLFSPMLQNFICLFIYLFILVNIFSLFPQSWRFFLSEISLLRGACKLFFAARRKVGYQTGWVTFAANFRNQNKKRALQYTFPLECSKTRETRWRIFRHVVGLNGAGRWGKADRPNVYERLMRIFTRSKTEIKLYVSPEMSGTNRI